MFTTGNAEWEDEEHSRVRVMWRTTEALGADVYAWVSERCQKRGLGVGVAAACLLLLPLFLSDFFCLTDACTRRSTSVFDHFMFFSRRRVIF